MSQEVNSGAYLARHNGQIFSDGRSFSGFERNMTWLSSGLGAGQGYADLSAVSGADSPNDARSVLAVDFDDDGDLDLFVHSVQRERHALYRNDAVQPGSQLGSQPGSQLGGVKAAGFLKIRLTATTNNREAIGATVIVDGGAGLVAQVMARGAGFESCGAPELVFGLGAHKNASVEVLWPGGSREDFGVIRAGTRVTLIEGTGKGKPFRRQPMTLLDPLPPGLRVEVGDLLPALYLKGADGKDRIVEVAELTGGRPVLLNLWATFCGPCVRELPDLEEIHQTGDQRVVTICVDGATAGERASSLLKKAGVTFATFNPAADDAAETGTALRLSELADLERLSLPTTLVITADGRVDAILRGALK